MSSHQPSILPELALGPPARQPPSGRLRGTARTNGGSARVRVDRTGRNIPSRGTEKAEFRGSSPASRHIATPRSSESREQRSKCRSRGISDRAMVLRDVTVPNQGKQVDNRMLLVHEFHRGFLLAPFPCSNKSLYRSVNIHQLMVNFAYDSH